MSNQSQNDDRAPTIRTTPVDADLDALPDQASQYVAPQPLPRVSEHKTIDMVPVRLAPEVDPRRALTRRLETPVAGNSRRVWLVLAAAALLFAALVFGLVRLLPGSPGSPESGPGARLSPGGHPASLPTPSLLLPSAAAAVAAPAAALVNDESTREPPAPGLASPPSARAPASSKPATKTDSKGRQVWLE